MPKESIQIINFLINAGMTDREFQVIHHKEGITIKSHIAYCENVDSFQTSSMSNLQVKERLTALKKLIQCNVFSTPVKKGVLKHLVEAVICEIPVSIKT